MIPLASCTHSTVAVGTQRRFVSTASGACIAVRSLSIRSPVPTLAGVAQRARSHPSRWRSRAAALQRLPVGDLAAATPHRAGRRRPGSTGQAWLNPTRAVGVVDVRIVTLLLACL